MEEENEGLQDMDLSEAVADFARTLKSFDELEYSGAFNESIEELMDATEEGPWPLFVELFRAWPPELFAELLERLEADESLRSFFERIDEETIADELSKRADSPEALLARMR